MIGRAASHLRDLNSRAMLGLLLRQGPTARVHLAQTLGLSKATVTAATRDLLDAGLVCELGEDETQPRLSGRQPQPIDVNPQAASLIAVDIGAVRTTAVLADLRGEIICSGQCSTPQTDAAAFLRSLEALTKGLLDNRPTGTGPLGAVVVGIPGMVSTGNVIDDSVNVPALRGLPLHAELTHWCGALVRLENDINLAAIGEHTVGSAGEYQNFAFVSLGTGIGAGLYIGGRLHRGAHGFAGEIGEMVLREVNGEPIGLERLVAGSVLGQRGQAQGLDDATPQALVCAARSGNAAALAIIRQAATALAHGLLNIHLLLDLEAVVLGGGVGRQFDVWADTIGAVLGARHSRPPLLRPSSLAQPTLSGALALAREDCWESLLSALTSRRKQSVS